MSLKMMVRSGRIIHKWPESSGWWTMIIYDWYHLAIPEIVKHRASLLVAASDSLSLRKGNLSEVLCKPKIMPIKKPG